MKGSEIDDPGHLIGLEPRRFPNWGDRQKPIKICPLCSLTINKLSFCGYRSSNSSEIFRNCLCLWTALVKDFDKQIKGIFKAFPRTKIKNFKEH